MFNSCVDIDKDVQKLATMQLRLELASIRHAELKALRELGRPSKDVERAWDRAQEVIVQAIATYDSSHLPRWPDWEPS
jgi:hypothetical protein